MGGIYVLGLLPLIALLVYVKNTSAQVKPLFIDSGSNSTSVVDERTWFGDSLSGNNLSLSYPGFITTIPDINGALTYRSLYRTVRLFDMPSNYTFNFSGGSYYVRLHFYPFVVGNRSADDAKFGVIVNDVRLLTNYNVSEEIANKNSYLRSLGSNLTLTSLLKEYFVNTRSNELWIEFTPSSGSFAFVNAIEVIPVLDKVFFNFINKVGSDGSSSSLNLINRGLETMYRLNVGEPAIEPNQDQDLWRKWELDSLYMYNENTANVIKNKSTVSYADSNASTIAPLAVYTKARVASSALVLGSTFNLSWKFAVDPGFDYLVRLHFCELVYGSAGIRAFNIYINFKTAEDNFDVFERAGGKNKAFHEDYVEPVSSQIDTLWLQLGPDAAVSASDTEAILSGLEIFKLSKSGNLAYVPSKKDPGGGLQRNGANRKKVTLAVGAAASVGVILSIVLCVTLFCFFYKKKKTETVKASTPRWRPLVLCDNITGSTTNVQGDVPASMANGYSAPTRTGRRFAISVIRAATNNFEESLVIGTGGFGKVYRGTIEEGLLVAVKRAHPHSEQGLAEFETEIEMLSKLRHRHLVSMIGYCDEQGEMILVYEYMANGTLRNHLFGSDLPPLSWKQRLEVCIGAARGLHYLHTGADRGIIHRDVKTTNILLDENFVAKVADFGLSKTGPAFDHTHVSTAVRGSFGYLDPEYFRRQKLTQKSDVYSFGVVLFEIVCARPVINPSLPRDQISLAEWAIRWQREGSLATIVDPRLERDYSVESLLTFGKIAEKCLAEDGRDRPTMGEVLWHLENVLHLHETYTRVLDGVSSGVVKLPSTSIPLVLPLIREEEEDAAACCEPKKLEESSLLSMDSLGHSTSH